MSPTPVRTKLAQNLVLLSLLLAEDLSCLGATTYVTSNQHDLLQHFQLSLPISVPPQRPKRDEAQITSLIRALLELSGGRRDLLQHRFAEEYTVIDHANLYASILGITRTKAFGGFDSREIKNTLLGSPVFSGMTVDEQDLENWTAHMMKCLRIGSRDTLVRHLKRQCRQC